MMDLDRLTMLLNKYDESEQKDFENLAIDEKQRAYIAGYMERQKEEDALLHLDEIETQIKSVRSKYCEPILNILEEEDNIYHGDLAEKLNLSASGLNAVVKKMQEVTIPLLKIDEIGKYKIYSLSDEVRRYVIRKSDSGIDVKNVEQKPKESLFIFLQRFIDAVDGEWREVLCNLLRGEEYSYSDDVVFQFNCFSECAIGICKENRRSLDEVKQFLKNELLCYALDEFLEVSFKYDQFLNEYFKETGSEINWKLLKRIIDIRNGKKV